ncbi:MAG: polysaccharide biosynthesis/export family protein [Candidatus Aminicenantes bacterium]|nr:polysaccharide biosynthesis/export family protein [Candidatus Aminicenantes bacterium]
MSDKIKKLYISGKKFLFLPLIALLLSGIILGNNQEKISLEYRIGPKDLLEISVFGLDELNTTVRVSEEGKITLPLLGEVEVQGLTKTQVEKKLAELLERKYLQNPQVTVFIKEYQSKRVSVLGAVRNPGPYELLGRQTLLQIISEAGGMTEDAGETIIIIRQLADGSSTTLRIPVEDLVVKGDASLNIVLRPGDIVNIPIDKIVHVYVFGQVRNPGALAVKRSHIPTLLQAIAQAGGFAERANKGRVLIKRKGKDGREIQIKVNVKDIIKGKKKDIQLQENDVVFVPETIF